jgi:polyphosphate kinase 2 (PPK2 family)
MSKSIDTKNFRVRPGEKVSLSDQPTSVRHLFKSKKQYHHMLASQVQELSKLQRLHYASDRSAILLIFQGMDAAGKDGAIRHVMSGVNPQGCQVFSFKQPSAEELDHDFLWRTSRRLPERGRIGIFNRSYYEEVLVARVHPENNWKLSLADVAERKSWTLYQQAYEAALGSTSTAESPWYVVPADSKKNARLIIAQIIIDAFHEIPMAYPKATAKRKKELKAIRSQL